MRHFWNTTIRPNDQNVMGKRVDGRCDIQFCRQRFQQWNADRLFNLRYSCFSKKCISMLTLFFMSCTHTYMHNAQFTLHMHSTLMQTLAQDTQPDIHMQLVYAVTITVDPDPCIALHCISLTHKSTKTKVHKSYRFKWFLINLYSIAKTNVNICLEHCSFSWLYGI